MLWWFLSSPSPLSTRSTNQERLCSGKVSPSAVGVIARLPGPLPAAPSRTVGLKDLHSQNIILLLKLLHKFCSGQDTPWTRWIIQTYHPFQTGFRTSTTYTSTWNTIARLMPLYMAITSVEVGDGKTISFWYDDWTSMSPLNEVFPLPSRTAPAKKSWYMILWRMAPLILSSIHASHPPPGQNLSCCPLNYLPFP